MKKDGREAYEIREFLSQTDVLCIVSCDNPDELIADVKATIRTIY